MIWTSNLTWTRTLTLSARVLFKCTCGECSQKWQKTNGCECACSPGTHLWSGWSWSVGPTCWCCSKWLWTHTLVWLCFHTDMLPRWHREQTHTAPKPKQNEFWSHNFFHWNTKLWLMQANRAEPACSPWTGPQCLTVAVSNDSSGIDDAVWQSCIKSFQADNKLKHSNVNTTFVCFVYEYYLHACAFEGAWKWFKRAQCFASGASVVWLKYVLCLPNH